MDPQYFKGDATELKYDASGEPILSLLSSDKDDFYQGAYSCAELGDVLYDSNRAPLANAIKSDIFRLAFASVFEAFRVSGTFESYLLVFQTIFGDDVEVSFTVPAPGKLNIDISAEESDVYDLLARYIESNAYAFDEIITQDGDNLAAQVLRGFQTQYEVEQMLFELVPAGIYTQITLSIEV